MIYSCPLVLQRLVLGALPQPPYPIWGCSTPFCKMAYVNQMTLHICGFHLSGKGVQLYISTILNDIWRKLVRLKIHMYYASIISYVLKKLFVHFCKDSYMSMFIEEIFGEEKRWILSVQKKRKLIKWWLIYMIKLVHMYSWK